MNIDLRDDERFVIDVLAATYAGEWLPGNEPPDAYLKIGKETIAVEISTLTQHVFDENGKFKPRLSHDSTALGLIEEFNDDLGSSVPSGETVFIVLTAPLKQKRKLKPLLAESILGILGDDSKVDSEYELNILSNELKVKIIPEERPSGKKVIGTVINQHSTPDILLNARQILDNRIAIKSEKCQQLHSNGQVWLALLNDYWLADVETYKQAMGMSKVAHSFDKILLISGNKSIVTLYGK